MKRITILMFTVLAAALVLGCSIPSAELTTHNLGAFNSQWAPERTSFDGDNLADYFFDYYDNVNVSTGAYGALSAATGGNRFMEISFANTPAALDLKKYKTLAEVTAPLKTAVQFYSYTANGVAATLTPPAITPLNYNVVKWLNNVATVELILSEGLSNRIEMRFDPNNYTHHNGMKLDLNGDGVIGPNDTYIIGQWTVAGTTPPAAANNVAWTPATTPNPRMILFPNVGFYNGVSDPTNPVPNFTLGLDAALAGIDTFDYASTINSLFKVQKYDVAQKRWVDTGITGTYSTTDFEMRFNLTGAVSRDYYRLIAFNYEGMKSFTTSASFFGFTQKCVDTFGPSNMGGFPVFVSQVIPDGTTSASLRRVVGNPFSATSVSDGANRNVVVTVNFTVPALAGETGIGQGGLPDPNAALAAKQILLAYRAPNTTSDLWNNWVIIPVSSIATYKSDPSSTAPDNRWQITLPAGFVSGNGETKYLLINTDYRTLGDTDGTNVRYFGSNTNVDFVYQGNTQYASYNLGTTF